MILYQLRQGHELIVNRYRFSTTDFEGYDSIQNVYNERKLSVGKKKMRIFALEEIQWRTGNVTSQKHEIKRSQ